MTARASLRVVDETTGELHDSCPTCVKLEHEITVLQKKMRGMARELGEALGDKEAEARANPNWSLGYRIFQYHNRVFGHEKCKWSPARFLMIERLLGEPDGLERALRAISGHRRDVWSLQRKRTLWEHVFESQKTLEGALVRCPEPWTPPAGAGGLL